MKETSLVTMRNYHVGPTVRNPKLSVQTKYDPFFKSNIHRTHYITLYTGTYSRSIEIRRTENINEVGLKGYFRNYKYIST